MLKKAAYLGIIVFILNSLAMKFFWYYTVWWFDMPMHFLGGVFISLLAMFLLNKKLFKFNYRFIFYTFLSVLLVGVLWEIFEYALEIFVSHQPQIILDTFSDIFFDMAGGLFGIIYFVGYNKIINLNN